jgi:hypothetical protein
VPSPIVIQGYLFLIVKKKSKFSLSGLRGSTVASAHLLVNWRKISGPVGSFNSSRKGKNFFTTS